MRKKSTWQRKISRKKRDGKSVEEKSKSEIKSVKKKRNRRAILEEKERGERGKSAEKVTCWNRKERKQPSFSPIHVGSMLHKDFFVVVLLDKGLLPWERRQWHHLNWLSLCPAETKASSHPGGVRPLGRGGCCVCVYLCALCVLPRVCIFVGT